MTLNKNNIQASHECFTTYKGGHLFFTLQGTMLLYLFKKVRIRRQGVLPRRGIVRGCSIDGRLPSYCCCCCCRCGCSPPTLFFFKERKEKLALLLFAFFSFYPQRAGNFRCMYILLLPLAARLDESTNVCCICMGNHFMVFAGISCLTSWFCSLASWLASWIQNVFSGIVRPKSKKKKGAFLS